VHGRDLALHGNPNVLAKYRCRYGHYFATLRVFDGVLYQEHYTSSEQLMFVNKFSID
jgi:hypothetical protein